MTDNCEFKPGDVVRLRSGGPRMTVRSADMGAHGWHVHCDWIIDLGYPQSGAYNAAQLAGERSAKIIDVPVTGEIS